MLTFKLNGQDVEVEPGTTILNAARAQSVEIPTFCYQKRLSTLASCRMCLVEVEGRPKLEPACATVIADGMSVLSHSARVVSSREDMLEILLANHPLDCPVCDKGGECELQDTVFEYGKGDSRLYDPKRVFRTRDIELNKVITFNANRCIQCQRCVRVCEELVGEVALGTMERGLDSEITGVGNSLKNCSHCGNCIEVCPVGALMSTPYRYKARPWDLERTETSCNFCGTGCSMSIETRNGELMRVKSQYETGINGELLCAKGRFGFDAIDGGERITQPMIRKNGVLTAVSWADAIEFIATRLKSILNNKGHIKGLISPRQTNETAFMFQKLMRDTLQTSDIHSSCRYSGLRQDPDTIETFKHFLSKIYSRLPLDKILQSDCLFLLGSNISDENPVSGYLLRQQKRDHPNQLLIASSRPCGLDDIAAEKLRLLPGNEAMLLSALACSCDVSVDKNMFDFVCAAKVVLEEASSITLLIGTEFMRGHQVRDCLLWIEKTVALLQQKDKKVFVQFLFDRPNQLGLWHMGCLPDIKTETQVKVSELFYVIGADPIGDCSENDPLELAALNTPFLIVQNSVMTASAQKATVLLPAPSFGEEDGSYTNNEGRVQGVNSIRSPMPGVLQNAEIFARIANSLNSDIGLTSSEQIFSQIRQGIKGYQDLRQDNIMGPEINDYGFSTASPADDSISEVPMVYYQSHTDYALITGDNLFGSGNLSARSKILSDLSQGAYVEMNPGTNFDSQMQNYLVTVTRGDACLTAPLKINRRFPEKLIYITENHMHTSTNKILKYSEYPCIVKVEIIAGI